MSVIDVLLREVLRGNDVDLLREGLLSLLKASTAGVRVVHLDRVERWFLERPDTTPLRRAVRKIRSQQGLGPSHVFHTLICLGDGGDGVIRMLEAIQRVLSVVPDACDWPASYRTEGTSFLHFDAPGGQADIVHKTLDAIRGPVVDPRAVTAALGKADTALLMVGADGASTETSLTEALHIARALGVGNVVVFVSGCDRLNEPDELGRVRREAESALETSGFTAAGFIFGSVHEAVESALINAPPTRRGTGSVERLIELLEGLPIRGE